MVWATVVWSDVLFFGAVYLVFMGFYLISPSRHCARLTLILATLITGWSFLNIGWMFASSVQLQPAIVGILISGIGDHWTPLKARPSATSAAGATTSRLS